jgi:hypothetical protein
MGLERTCIFTMLASRSEKEMCDRHASTDAVVMSRACFLSAWVLRDALRAAGSRALYFKLCELHGCGYAAR